MSAHVLSFGYDRLTMRIRTMVLMTKGYEVTEVYSLQEALRLVSVPGYDLLLICHTVPEDQQQAVMERAEYMDGGLRVLCLTETPGIKYSENCETASNTAPELLRQIDEALGKSKERRAA
ncbi:MAG TPA: hypothetical protein VHN74_19390 [Candidatus Angelobacter sp.]|jgi:DNA-binding NtrC family response regulator|nr:hypothetical protein [Candidatus Angelobacter sp.]